VTDGDFGVVTAGYVIMRLALVANWLRVARSEPYYRAAPGHYVVFASAAAVGAGLQVAVDHDTHHFTGSTLVTGYAIALPVAVFLLTVWLLLVRGRPDQHTPQVRWAYPVAAVAVLATPFLGAPVHLTALVLAALVAVGQVRGPTAGTRISRG
jgi:hypothetical protein